MTEENIKDILKKISDNQEKLLNEKETKGFKLPFRAKLSKAKIKKNFVTAIVIYENRNFDFIKVPIQDGCITIDGVPRISTTDNIIYFKGKPFIIIPNWSLKPFSPTEQYEDDIKNNTTNAGRKLLIAKLKSDLIVPKKSFGGLGWILILLIVVGVGFYLFKGGKLF